MPDGSDYLLRSATLSALPIGESAHFLGIRIVIDHLGHKVLTSANGVKRWAQSRTDPDEYSRAVDTITDHFRKLDLHIDYRQRRLALQNWFIPVERWNDVIDSITPSRGAHDMRGDFHRYFASALVWGSVTSGERR
ncbi:hypothetical protein [Nocardia sp. Marseille-Q1738]